MKTKHFFILLSAVFAGCATPYDGSLSKNLYDARKSRLPEFSGELKSTAIVSSLPEISGDIGMLDAINLALGQNLELRATFLNREIAAGAITEVRAGAYPSMTLGGSAESDMADRGDNPETYAATWSISQPLWRSGVVSAGLRYAKLYAASVDEVIREKVQDVISIVIKDYYDVLLAKQMVGVYTEAVGVAERMLDTAQKKRKAGSASSYEVLRAEVEVASTKASLIKEQNAFRTACVALLQQMGVNQSSAITLTDELAYEPETNGVDRLTYTAMLKRPDILQAEAAVRMAVEEQKTVKGSYGPTADLVARGEFGNPDPNNRAIDDWNHDWSVGVEVSYKLFDGFERKGKLEQSSAKLKQARANLENTEALARVEIVKALLDVRNADELYISQAKNIELSREALRMLESGHNVGKNTQIEVLDARSALTEAMGQYYNALYSHEVARLAVRKASGTLGIDAARAAVRGEKLEKTPL